MKQLVADVGEIFAGTFIGVGGFAFSLFLLKGVIGLLLALSSGVTGFLLITHAYYREIKRLQLLDCRR